MSEKVRMKELTIRGRGPVQQRVFPLVLFVGLFFCWVFASSSVAALAKPLLVDDFEGEDIRNVLGNRANVFIKAPSKAMVSRRSDTIQGRTTNVLMLRYDKRNAGGPYGGGGWCGYYTLVKSPGALVAPSKEDPNPEALGEQYLDGTEFRAISFWVRGAEGEENFVVGLSDRHWDRIGDSVKSEEIGKYLPAGRITTAWQKATVPLDEFFLDYGQLASVAIVFEGDLYPLTGQSGTVYFDDITLE